MISLLLKPWAAVVGSPALPVLWRPGGACCFGGIVATKNIPAQPEIPGVAVFRNKGGGITVAQEPDSSGVDEGGQIILDNTRAILLAMALIETVKGE